MNGAGGVIVVLIIIGLYWIPTIVAGVRHVPNVGSVAVINGLLGWSLVGWAIALAMATRSQPQLVQVNVSNTLANTLPPPVPSAPVPPAITDTVDYR